MRFFRQAARRAAVLLLCLSMLIPAFAATTDPATETPAHNPVCSDNQDENHDPIYKAWLTDDGVSGGGRLCRRPDLRRCDAGIPLQQRKAHRACRSDRL